MSTSDRLHALDAVRAFALLLGVAFHAGFSFLPGLPPGIWAINDSSPSTAIAVFLFVAHIFRMSLFFFVAGFFARMLYQRGGARGFWTNRLKRILLPLIAGWVVIFPALAVVWIWGLTKTFGGTLPQAPANLPPAPPLAFPLTHLWFLYYLLVLYVALLLGRRLLLAIDRRGWLRRTADTTVSLAVRSAGAAVALALPLTLALYFRATWFAWFGVPTPDQSLLPEVASFVGFGTAMAFGWLVHRQRDLLEVWARQWPLHAAGATIATAACLWMVGPTPAFVPAAPGLTKLALAFSYSTAIWCWCFAAIGLAMRVLSGESPRIRYIADASYWIYLVHLPIVAALQVGVGHLPLHWSLKFPLILVASFALLFASYRYLVRSTFIGQFLNGRRYPRTVATPGPGADPSGQPPRSSTDSAERSSAGSEAPIVAALAGVHKRYGTTHALAGLDLQVRRGELLAVLGPNGAGKSTAISLWLGLLEPDEGSVRLFAGSPLDVESRRHVGVMMQEVGLTPELRVRELVALDGQLLPGSAPDGPGARAHAHAGDCRIARTRSCRRVRSARSSSRSRSAAGRPCSSSTSRPSASTSRRAKRCGGSSARWLRTVAPSSSRRTISRRPRRSPIAWRSWRRAGCSPPAASRRFGRSCPANRSAVRRLSPPRTCDRGLTSSPSSATPSGCASPSSTPSRSCGGS